MITYCTRKYWKHPTGHHNTIKVRSMKHYSKMNLWEKLSAVNWMPALNCHNVDEAWNNFKDIFLGVIDNIAPVRTRRVKQGTQPWFTNEILNTIKKRDRALKTFRASNDHTIYSQYKKLHNKVQQMVERAKEEYYKTTLQNNKTNPKKLWQTLNKLGSTKTVKSNTSIGLNIDGTVNFDLKKVTAKFNSFFTTIASSLVENLPPTSGLYGKTYFNNYYRSLGVSQNTFGLLPVNNEQVSHMLKSVDKTKATGLDNIPARFVSDAAEYIAPSITHIINMSLLTAQVPSSMKMAKVTPLHKKGSKTDAGNYRPISVLSIISKILERVVYNQLYEYIERNNLLCDLQSGFRRSYSTETCLIYLNDYLKEEIDKGNYCGMVLLDLQKAFDSQPQHSPRQIESYRMQ